MRSQPHRLGINPFGPTAIDQRVRGIALRALLLADDDIGAPRLLAAQVTDGHVAGVIRRQRGPPRLGKPVRPAPIDPGALTVLVAVAADKHEVGTPVAVEVAAGDGQGAAAAEAQRGATGAVRTDRHQQRPVGKGHEQVRRPAEVNNLGQGASGTHPFFFGHVRQVRLDGGVGLVAYQDLAVALRVDPVGAAPVDPRRAARGVYVEVGVAIAVEVRGTQLAGAGRGGGCGREVQVGVYFGLEGQLRLVVEPDLAVGDEGQVRPAVAVEVAAGGRGAAVRGEQ